MSASSYTITTRSSYETCKLAQRLAPQLQMGDVVLLTGEIGTGKTHFARCLIRSLMDVPEDIPSPTFTLVQTYETKGFEIWHSDLYRLSDIYEIEELGLTEAFQSAVCLIEWPDRLGPFTPEGALHISISGNAQNDTRDWLLEWQNTKWTTKLEGLLNGSA
ncbi:tRNA threonylcarbamoyladenosine biosynthesis protein TsaE [Roseovarius albus]|uniref:tRNA threonylcarbamoyladenosine biosynthesis protein TsaE n=1 Tax=Roseovarius albus TaxID=1247867 RepID=A0A1X6Z4E3_9RHOB|nr:tRNA (adenosine(37)-N6)-threonylcarbamoyltransferase complex ATPase subunit type 1 TsaE [Roseovarius albus]SLN40386.1 tRNA threonylcarbamoyladenosine biosynthesis protein TsaE [Roseovarius albus]